MKYPIHMLNEQSIRERSYFLYISNDFKPLLIYMKIFLVIKDESNKISCLKHPVLFQISSKRRSLVTQHLKTATHLKNQEKMRLGNEERETIEESNAEGPSNRNSNGDNVRGEEENEDEVQQNAKEGTSNEVATFYSPSIFLSLYNTNFNFAL